MIGTPEPQIYHNPRCSKSRATLELLIQRGFEPTVIEYLETPPDRSTLKQILETLGLEPRELMRQQEAPYKEHSLSDPGLSNDDLIDAMIKYPILIERPIVLVNDKVAIGRPPENVLDIL